MDMHFVENGNCVGFQTQTFGLHIASVPHRPVEPLMNI